jgi:hypothetical protein
MMFSSVRFATKGICVVVVGNIIGHYSSAYLHSNDNALHVKDLFADFAKPHIKD